MTVVPHWRVARPCSPIPVPWPPFPVPGSPFPAFGSYPQRRMPIRPCQKPSNSGQNRSKRRRFPSKSGQKGAHFVMPILTFWGWTPSGASARAVFAFRKGKKGAFPGPPGRVPKLSTVSTKGASARTFRIGAAARPGGRRVIAHRGNTIPPTGIIGGGHEPFPRVRKIRGWAAVRIPTRREEVSPVTDVVQRVQHGACTRARALG